MKRNEKVTAKKYIMGCLHNRKIAYMFKLTNSPNCLLCGQLDGAHHIASGCPCHIKMYTHRHDKAVRLIVQAILRGRRGGYLIAMDAGSKARCEEDGITGVPRSIPVEALPEGIPRDGRRPGTNKAQQTRCFLV